MSGRMIIKAFNWEEQSRQEIRQAAEQLAEEAGKADFLTQAINPAIRFVNRVGQVLITVIGGKLLIDGVMTVGAIQAFLQ